MSNTPAFIIDDDELIESEPTRDEAPQTTAPRRRGRPPGSKNKNPTIRNTNTSASGVRALRRGTKPWIVEQWRMLVGLANIGVNFISKEDVLSENEMNMVVEAATAETMSNERILHWMSKASSVTPHFLLIQCVVLLAIPRLQRRGIIPKPRALTPEEQAIVDEHTRTTRTQSETQSETSGEYSPDTGFDSVPVGAGSAYGNNRGHWQR